MRTKNRLIKMWNGLKDKCNKVKEFFYDDERCANVRRAITNVFELLSTIMFGIANLKSQMV